MKYALVLFITLLLSLTASSQVGTVILSYPTAKKIALELVSCDSVKTSLEITNNILNVTEQKCRFQDSVIKGYESKEVIFLRQISLHESIENSYQIQVNDLKEKLSRQKVKNRVTIGVTAFITASLLYTLSSITK